MASYRWAYVLAVGLTVGCGGGSGDDDDDDNDVAVDAAAPVFDAAPPPADAGAAILSEDLPNPLPSGDVDAVFTTYNAGIIQTIVWPEERLPLVIDAVKAFDADVVCMQEIFVQYTNPKEVADAVKAEYPYSFWTWTQEHVWGSGLLILSKHPMYRGRELWFPTNDPSNNIDRMVIGADVVTPDAYFSVLCTHLEAYAPSARSAETDELNAWAQTEGYLDRTTILLGDMNCGVETGTPCTDCDQEVDVASFAKLKETWDDLADGLDECTYCRDRSDPMQLIPPQGKAPDERIDHCMAVNYAPSTVQSTTIILDDIVTYTAGGEQRMTQRSDHKGVRCELGPAL